MADDIRIRQVLELGVIFSKQEKELYLKFIKMTHLTKDELKIVVNGINRLIELNDIKKVYDAEPLFDFFKSMTKYAIKKAG